MQSPAGWEITFLPLISLFKSNLKNTSALGLQVFHLTPKRFSFSHLPANSSPRLINLRALLPPPELPYKVQETSTLVIKSQYLTLSETVIIDSLLSLHIFQLKNNNHSRADSLFPIKIMLWPRYEISLAATETIY